MLNPKTLIHAHNIHLNRNGKILLDNINFEIKKGDFITLIGPNGAGKSSLIKVILGLIKPNSGVIKKAKKLILSYTPQKFTPNEFIPINVADFLRLNQTCDAEYLLKNAQLTGIEKLLSNALTRLSGGEMQRVLLTRALLAKPDLLILDEPTQGLDIDGQMQFYQLIQDIHQTKKCAVLMVSHDLHRVMKQSSQVLCLNQHICCMGKPEMILKDAQFNALFSMQMEGLMATYEHHHNHCHSH
jgi:zinc transport system ATP-binding protein